MESQPAPGRSHAPGPPSRSRVALILPVAVITLTAALLAWSVWPTVRPTRQVRVTQAIFESASQPDPSPAARSVRTPTVQAAGWLEAEPYITAVAALADGTVATVPVLEGDRVEPGQIVATLVDDDARLAHARARAELVSAESSVRYAAAQRAAARTDWDHPVELERRAASTRAALAEARAQLDRLPHLRAAAAALLVTHTEELRRVTEAYEQQAATDLELVIARQRAQAQEAEVAAIDAQRPVLEATVSGAESEARAAERDLALRVDDTLRLESAAASLQQAQARRDHAAVALEEAALRLERMTVRAPHAGYVQRRLKTPGDKAILMMDSPHSAHIVHIYDPARLQVRVDVPLADAPHVAVGQPCEVIVEVLPDTTFAGRVLRITHEADLQKNTLQVKVGIDDPSALLKPEMLTRVRFLGSGDAPNQTGSAGASESSVRVPVAAIDTSTGTDRVWFLADRRAARGVARPVGITVTDRSEDWATVTGPLAPGALLITDPGGLRADQPVTLAQSSGGGRP